MAAAVLIVKGLRGTAISRFFVTDWAPCTLEHEGNDFNLPRASWHDIGPERQFATLVRAYRLTYQPGWLLADCSDYYRV
jgi:hypothetical protein